MRSVQHYAVAALLGCLACAVASAQPVRSVPLHSEITHVQPMTGVVLWMDNAKAAEYSDAIALEYRYCGYNEVVRSDGTFDFSAVERILDEVAQRRHQAILRFYFCYVGKETTVPDFIRLREDYKETIGVSEKKRTHFCDWSNRALQEFVLDFYSKFAEEYDDDPRIGFLQTGFGLWAEYHIYSGPKKLGATFPSKKFQASFLRHLDQQFKHLPWSISIDAADYDYSPLEDNEPLLALGFGLFDDSFLCKQHARENAVNWKTLDPKRWMRQPAGGEFSYYNRKDQKNALRQDGPNGVSFEEAAKRFHVSYMIGNDQPRYQSKKRIKQAGMATGYRFRVTEASVQDGVLRLKVVNEGVAPLYRDAFFSAGKLRSATSLKGLLPGKQLECSIAGVGEADLENITIYSDAILPTQSIQYNADLD
ncbi:MAG: DUF4832 domain-containing protein [Aureliella sp.]